MGGKTLKPLISDGPMRNSFFFGCCCSCQMTLHFSVSIEENSQRHTNIVFFYQGYRIFVFRVLHVDRNFTQELGQKSAETRFLHKPSDRFAPRRSWLTEPMKRHKAVSLRSCRGAGWVSGVRCAAHVQASTFFIESPDVYRRLYKQLNCGLEPTRWSRP